MSSQDGFDGAPASPSPISRTVASSLHFNRPARGKRSTNDLKKASSRASLRKAASRASMRGQNQDPAYDESQDEELSRSSSPAPSVLSVGNTSQMSLPPTSHESGLSLVGEALQKVMEDAYNGSYAAGLLGQKLLNQQERMRQLMQQLEDSSGQGDEGATAFAEKVQLDIVQMKQEQQEFMRKLLEVTSMDMGAVGISATTKAEAKAIINSYGGGMSTSVSYNSLSATPTKPVSSNAREIRRQKNAAAPSLHDDVGFVNDIQQQLINELRRVQTLIAERDKTIAAMAESLEEAARFKAMQEANIKKLESEKDAKDAHLYEAERKEAMIREENDDIGKQLKKNENEIRLLKRQLGEKTDAAEALKMGNEELEQKVDDVLSNFATMKAKGAADQMTINGLKSQVNDLEVKQRQAATKIPNSMSNLSTVMSYDHGSVDSMHAINDVDDPDGLTIRRAGGLNQALSPSASLDEMMVNKLRPSEAMKSLESDVAKWKAAALKYRKKWNDERKQTADTGKAADYDDSTDEDEDVWMEEAGAKTGEIRKRSISIKSRMVSSASSRKLSKTMGDAFGIARHQKTSTPWEEEEGDTPDRSLIDDDASSNGGNSTRASLDGFDPHFADPTIRSGAEAKQFKRRSTYTPANILGLGAKGSPLAQQLHLHGDSDEEAIPSSRNRVSSLIFEPGALGDELRGLDGGEDASMVKREEVEKLAEQHEAAMQAAVAELEHEHETVLTEREEVHQSVLSQIHEQHQSTLKQVQEQHQQLLKDTEVAHLAALTEKEETHTTLIAQHDAARREEIQVLHKEHAETLARQSQAHTEATATMQEKHKEMLASRDAQHEVERSELVQKHESKVQEIITRQAKQHEEAMLVARERHTETLSKAREIAQVELINAQMEHKKILGERDHLHQAEVQRLQAQHERALKQRDREHSDHVSDIEATHSLFQKQCDESYAKADEERVRMLEERDALLMVKEKDIIALRSRLSLLENELESLRNKSQIEEANTAAQAETLQQVREQLRIEQSERAVVEGKLASLPQEEAYSRKHSLDTEDDFQDAVDTSQSETAMLSERGEGGDGDDTIGAQDMLRQDTTSTRETSAEVETPVTEMLEAGAQTDDAMWATYQQAQMAAIRPASSLLEVEKPLGGIVVLGEHSTVEEDSPRRIRDSVSTFGGNRNGKLDRAESPAPTTYTVSAFTRQEANTSSRRMSEDSAYSAKASGENEEPTSSTPDRSKPPTMSVPPPPSMPPPATLPAKAKRVPVPALVTTTGPTDEDTVERPLSPTGTVSKVQKSKLRVPLDSTSRPSSRVSGPPPSAYSGRNTVAPRSSVARLGSEADKSKKPATTRRGSDAASIVSRSSAYRGQHPAMRAPSAQSYASDVTSDVSRVSGVSSRASDYNDGPDNQQKRSMMIGPGGQTVTTDPLVLGAITQTMIGDYLFKYTRRILGRSGHSTTRHRRYFWIHPYTRTLYWTLTAPAEAVAAEAVNKSAFIQDVQVVEDNNNTPPGLHYMSIVVVTQAREVKITAPTKERHDLWVTALGYLVNRETGTPAAEKGPSEWRQTISGAAARQRSQTGGPAYGSASLNKRPSMLSPARSFASMARRDASNEQVDRERTPRARGYSTSQASASQRRDTAAKEYLDHWASLKKFSGKPASTAVPVLGGSVTSGRQSALSTRSDREPMDPRLMTPEQMLEEDMGDKSFDGLENVRTCCDGKHDVSKLDNKSHQHHASSRAPRSRASMASVNDTTMRARKSKGKLEDGPLRLTGTGAPQLGALSLNTMHLPKQQSNADPMAKVSTSTQNSSGDWFTANEFGGLPASMGRATPTSQTYSASSSPQKAPTYSDRLTQIKKGKSQPWLR